MTDLQQNIFTEREKQILQMLANEKKITTILRALHIAKKTYYNHCASITRKTKKKTINGAVIFAIQYNLI